MVQLNAVQKEVIFKIIYLGPTESGKTTNLSIIEQKLPDLLRGRLSSILVSSKENLLIDFLPIEVSILDELKTRFNIFAIPGSSSYQNVRKLFLQEVDGIVFVATSEKLEENAQLFQEVSKNLQELNASNIPIILQWNKRDLPNAMDIKELHKGTIFVDVQEVLSIAHKGQGVLETLEKIITLALQNTIKIRTNNIKPLLSEKDLAKVEQGISLQIDGGGKSTTSFPLPHLLDRMTQTRSRLASLETSSIPANIEDKDFQLEETSWDSPSGKVVIIKMAGKIGINTCLTIKTKVLDHYMHGKFRLVLEFSKIEYIHSNGFGILIELGNRAQILGGGLALVGLQEKFKVVFELMGMGKSISLCQTEEQALLYFSSLKREEKYEPATVKRSSRAIQARMISTPKTPVANFSSVKRNVYISYEPNNISFAQWLSKSLEQKGYGIFLDEKRVQTNIIWNSELSHSVSSSDIVIVIWDKSSYSNVLMQHEYNVGRGLGKIVIFWLVEKTSILPLGFPDVLIIDASSEEEGLQQFEKIILNKKQSYNYNILPAFSCIPTNLQNQLIGRENQLLEIYEKLIACKNVALYQEENYATVEGFGKSSLAIEFAYRFGLTFEDGILWLPHNGGNDWHNGLQQLSYQLGLTNIPPEMAFCKNSINKLKEYIQQRPNLLLIVDYLQNIQELTQEVAYNFIPIALGCYILAISKTSQSISGVTAIQIQGLNPEASLQLVTRFRMPTNANETESAKKLCEAVSYMPLAIIIIAKYLAQNPYENFSKYLNDVLAAGNQSSQFILRDLTRSSSFRYAATINFIIKKLWEHIPNEYSRTILETMSLFPQGFIFSKDSLAIWSNLSSEAQGKDISLQELLEGLYNINFIEKVDKERIRLPTCIYNFLSQNISREQQQNRRKKASEKMLQLLQDFGRLEKEYYRHGFQYLRDILSRGLQWNDGNENLKVLQQSILRETKALQHRMILPYFFLQQVYSRVFSENDVESPILKNFTGSLPKISWIQNTFWLKRVNKFPYQKITNQLPTIIATFTSDDNYMISSTGKDLILFDMQSNQSQIILESKLANCQAILFSPAKGQVIATHNSRIGAWNLNNLNNFKWLTIQNDWINCLALSQNNLASAGKEQKIYLRNLDTNDEIVSPKIHSSEITKIAFCNNGSKLFSISKDHEILLWEIPNFKVLYRIKNESYLPTSISVASEKNIFAVGFQNGQIEIYQTQDGQIIHTLTQNCDKITSIAFSLDGQYMASTSQDHTLVLWNWSIGKLLQKFVAPCPFIRTQFSLDSSTLLACDAEGVAYKFKIMKI